MTRRRLLAAAACGLLLGGIVWLGSDGRPQEQRYVTAVGASRRLVLPDRSELLLNTDTEARVRNGRPREVRLLHGEALVTARPGGGPFVVQVGGWVLQTPGAIFAVRDDAGHVVVAVLQGELTLLHAGRVGGRLTSSFEAVLDPAGGCAVHALTGSQLDDRLAWRDGQVTFRHVALADAVAEMNRYLAVRIRVADPSVARLTVLGTWPVARPAEFVSSLEAEFGLHAVQGDGEILLTRQAPAPTDHSHP